MESILQQAMELQQVGGESCKSVVDIMRSLEKSVVFCFDGVFWVFKTCLYTSLIGIYGRALHVPGPPPPHPHGMVPHNTSSNSSSTSTSTT